MSELTPKHAHELNEKIISLKQRLNRNFIDIGKYLKVMRDDEAYKQLGYETFEIYLGIPELAFNRSTAYNLIVVYETFVLDLKYEPEQLAEADYSKLARILPTVKVQPVGHEEWFGKALTLSRSDLEKELKEAKGEKVEDDLHCYHCPLPNHCK